MRRRSNPWPESFSYADRFHAVANLVAKEKKKLIAFPNVVAIGVGMELHGRRGVRGRGRVRRVCYGAEGDAQSYVPCVHVVVSRKWRTRRKKKGELPETLSTRITVHGKRLRVEVPVDVVEQRATRLHVLWRATATNGVDSLSGTGSCFVRQKGKRSRFLLSCHHVLALTEKHYPPANLEDIAVDWSDNKLGDLAKLPWKPDEVDAALAHADLAVPQVTFEVPGNGVIELGGSLGAGEPVDPASTYFVLTQHGVRRVHFIAEVEHRENYYGDGTPLTFGNVLHCLTLAGEPWLQPGDSGAALVDANGRLIGIHFAGLDPAGPDSYAQRADVVLSSFDIPLELA
ncbi:MAG TPA: hypothetical protein VHC69_10040 [Polyangiaceae bacterium]|nr:hypothetical protein [Polyangiaceae bacterium]